MTGRENGLEVGERTEVVIEGFPRSANTFAVCAFLHAQERQVIVAHHLHVPAQIVRGVARGLPTLLLLRAPEEAVLSLVLREAHLDLATALRDYIAFYEAVSPLRAGFVIAPFEEVTTRYGDTIERLNRRFGTRYAPFRHEKEVERTLFAEIEALESTVGGGVNEGRVARPSRRRERAAEMLREDLSSPSIRPLLARARAIHQRLAE